ncbi:peptidoglycan-binding protein [Bacillus sp. FSL W7-1360]
MGKLILKRFDAFFVKWLVSGFIAVVAFVVMIVMQEVHAAIPLTQGEEDERVEALQEELIAQGYLDGEETSRLFTETMEEAVIAYQEDHGLMVDGIVGPQTLGAMTVLREGSEGELVYMLQEKLSMLNYYQGMLDGIYGPLTKSAVSSFQQAEQIQVDGVAGPETYRHLYGPQVIAAAPASVVTEQQRNDHSPSKAAEASETIEPATNTAVEETRESEPTEETTSIQMEATAYTAYCNGCSGVTSTGIDLRANPNQKVVAVDPNVIPLGSRVYVEGYGEAIAGDTGGAIKGHKIDLYMQTKDEAYAFGRRTVNVTVLE